ncbi:Sybindin-like family protein [Dictyocaulus viviparus]|uniref:Trafficking protein particle complex subunit n=1 Tax=Dictyocaulus viviparus TaxID=29172 RepID=A0A0D8Y3A8_DICVI|nr:Sybindin-like family protein [Dictyocaulus viviparus]
MTIFNFYLFNRDGACVYYKEWRRDKQSGMQKSEEFKLMFGMLISLRSFAERLSSKDGNLVRYFKTSSYKMNYMEIPTGVKLIINTDPAAAGIPELLRDVYKIYVETVVKNALIDTSTQIKSDLFAFRVDQAVCSHPSYV